MKCDLVFHLKGRTRCLYCNTLLMGVADETVSDSQIWYRQEQKEINSIANRILRKDRIAFERVLKDYNIQGLDNMQYLIGSYFRKRTLGFLYYFCRNEIRIGKRFKRFFILPVNAFSILILPWMLLDILDSLYVHLVYNGYCEACGWKYRRLFRGSRHRVSECDYSREYLSVITGILSGNITKNEQMMQEHSLVLIEQNKKSAYYDLCHRNRSSTVSDILSIWFSMVVLVSLAVALVFPGLWAMLSNSEVGFLQLR